MIYPILVDQSPYDIFRAFLKKAPCQVVRCSVTDSMVSGAWGLGSFTLGKRGYLYYEPDYGIGYYESLPILAAWEPVDNADTFRSCFLNTYIRTWNHFCLPPAMGQWARGPFEIMLEAIGAVLRQNSSAWSAILNRLEEDFGSDGSRKQFGDLVEQAARRTGISSRVVSAILRVPWEHRRGGSVLDRQRLTEQESRALVAAFLLLIGRNI